MGDAEYFVSPFATVRWLFGKRLVFSPLSSSTVEVGADELAIADVFSTPIALDAAEQELRRRGASCTDLLSIIDRWEGLGILCKLEGTAEQRADLRSQLTLRGAAEISCLNILQVEYANTCSAMMGKPVDREARPVPWLSFPALEYLRQLDLSETRVFEYGAGNSTLYWGSVAKSVVAVETDVAWYRLLAPRVGPNVTLLHREGRAFVDAIHEHAGVFDVIVVDGAAFRYDCSVEAITKLASGGMIILDDSEALPNTARALRAAGLIQVDFAGFAAFEPRVQTTSLLLHPKFEFAPIGGTQPHRIVGGVGRRVVSADYPDNVLPTNA